VIDTELVGSPAQLRACALWLRQDLKRGLTDASTTLTYVRADRGAWSGLAADAFRARMGSVSTPVALLTGATTSGAQGIETFADALELAQTRISSARVTAAAAGLTLNPTAILSPAAVARPAALPTEATPAQVRSHSLAVAAHDLGVELGQAYARASSNVTEARTDLAAAEIDLERARAAAELVTVPTVDVLLSTVIDSTAAATVSTLGKQSEFLRDLAGRLEANTRVPSAPFAPELFYRDLDEAARLRAQALTVVDDASKARLVGRVIGSGAAVALTGVSIYMDIQAGESVAQASTSNLVGLGAAIAAGAAIGTLIPVPILGTAVGALGGAVVGIFASGMVDSMFENGPDVGAAVAAGWNDLVDTGAAIGDLASVGVEGVANATEAVADGLSNAWDSVFG